MALPGQKDGDFGHLMATFDSPSFFVCCHEKGKGSDLYISKQECAFCNVLTSEQMSWLSIPSYKMKKEKCELKDKPVMSDTFVDTSSSLTNPAQVLVVGVMNGQNSVSL